MNSYFLDTSIIIDFLIREKKETINIINTLDGNITSSYICLAELYEGVERIKNKNHEENTILLFFARLHNVFGLDHEIVRNFGHIRAELKSKGQVIEDIDIFIAATCIAHKQILITGNHKHFARVPGLKIFQSM